MDTEKPIRILRRGQPVRLDNVPPDRTLLDVLRDSLHCTAVKEGCGEGDCGACTVVLGESVNGSLRYKAINSCIRLAHSVDGMAVYTAQDLVTPSGELHPVQEALVRCHASQCGFCTPGFVMSLFGLYQNSAQGRDITRDRARAYLSGNLCRCTGYRPILDAAQQMGNLSLPADCAVDEAATLAALENIRGVPDPQAPYFRPQTLKALLQARLAQPQALVVAGTTDVGLWITKQHRRFPAVLDVTAAEELLRIERYPHHIAIGAAVTLSDAFAALIQDRPQLRQFAERFAGLPVRNSGTLGGNVANGSPIGDSMPLLIALGASVVLMRWDPEGASDGSIAYREMVLDDLYTGYRTNVMRPDELLCWIKVPLPTPGERSRAYKISKRFDDDISAVCLGVSLVIANGVILSASIGVGGVAAVPARARRTEAMLVGQSWREDTVRRAMDTLGAEFQPISDMRASAAYRRTVLANLLRRFWLDSAGTLAVATDVRQEVCE